MLCPQDIIIFYGKRFGIEVMFREMKQVICAFGYRFWSKRMPKLNRFKKKTDPEIIESVTSPQDQKRIKLAVKAIGGFMFCSIVATGLLQMTALRLSDTLGLVNLRYLRTKRSTTPSEATIADFLLMLLDIVNSLLTRLICMIALTVMRIIQNRIVKSGVVPNAAQKDVSWTMGLSGECIQRALNKWQVDLLPCDLYRFMHIFDPDLKLILDAFEINILPKFYRRADLKRIKTNTNIFT